MMVYEREENMPHLHDDSAIHVNVPISGLLGAKQDV
jgi:hypothetical protein